MAKATAPRQGFRKTALVLAYAGVAAFGAAAMQIVEYRPLDIRGYIVIGLVGIGALFAAALVMLFASRLVRLPPVLRFMTVFFGVVLATMFIQGTLAGVLSIFSGFIELGSSALDKILIISAIVSYGFVYYLAFGSILAWPVGLVAALLFSLCFLTLRPQNDTTEMTRRLK
jgi:hypothetical protein